MTEFFFCVRRRAEPLDDGVPARFWLAEVEGRQCPAGTWVIALDLRHMTSSVAELALQPQGIELENGGERFVMVDLERGIDRGTGTLDGLREVVCVFALEARTQPNAVGL